ncbi:MAG: hypothetical protein CMJ75_03555 [Planctomycetaceae bacterium]|nr:hypothetical protein [Planctomycetaceae bacterium]
MSRLLKQRWRSRFQWKAVNLFCCDRRLGNVLRRETPLIKIRFLQRAWCTSVSGLGLTVVGPMFSPASAFAAGPWDAGNIGSRRKLFVHRFLIDKLGDTRLK